MVIDTRDQFRKVLVGLEQLQPVLFAETHCKGDIERYIVLSLWGRSGYFLPEEVRTLVRRYAGQMLGWRAWFSVVRAADLGAVRQSLADMTTRGLLLVQEDPTWGRMYRFDLDTVLQAISSPST